MKLTNLSSLLEMAFLRRRRDPNDMRTTKQIELDKEADKWTAEKSAQRKHDLAQLKIDLQNKHDQEKTQSHKQSWIKDKNVSPDGRVTYTPLNPRREEVLDPRVNPKVEKFAFGSSKHTESGRRNDFVIWITENVQKQVNKSLELSRSFLEDTVPNNNLDKSQIKQIAKTILNESFGLWFVDSCYEFEIPNKNENYLYHYDMMSLVISLFNHFQNGRNIIQKHQPNLLSISNPEQLVDIIWDLNYDFSDLSELEKVKPQGSRSDNNIEKLMFFLNTICKVLDVSNYSEFSNNIRFYLDKWETYKDLIINKNIVNKQQLHDAFLSKNKRIGSEMALYSAAQWLALEVTNQINLSLERTQQYLLNMGFPTKDSELDNKIKRTAGMLMGAPLGKWFADNLMYDFTKGERPVNPTHYNINAFINFMNNQFPQYGKLAYPAYEASKFYREHEILFDTKPSPEGKFLYKSHIKRDDVESNTKKLIDFLDVSVKFLENVGHKEFAKKIKAAIDKWLTYKKLMFKHGLVDKSTLSATYKYVKGDIDREDVKLLIAKRHADEITREPKEIEKILDTYSEDDLRDERINNPVALKAISEYRESVSLFNQAQEIIKNLYDDGNLTSAKIAQIITEMDENERLVNGYIDPTLKKLIDRYQKLQYTDRKDAIEAIKRHHSQYLDLTNTEIDNVMDSFDQALFNDEDETPREAIEKDRNANKQFAEQEKLVKAIKDVVEILFDDDEQRIVMYKMAQRGRPSLKVLGDIAKEMGVSEKAINIAVKTALDIDD